MMYSKYLEQIINDESADKNLETLTENVKDLKARNDKPEKEIITVRHGVDNCRSEVIKMNDQILDEVNKDIVTKVEAMGKVKYEINNDVNRIKKGILEEVDTMDKKK